MEGFILWRMAQGDHFFEAIERGDDFVALQEISRKLIDIYGNRGPGYLISFDWQNPNEDSVWLNKMIEQNKIYSSLRR